MQQSIVLQSTQSTSNFTATELNLIHQVLDLINDKLRRNDRIKKLATIFFNSDGDLVTKIPKPNYRLLVQIHYTAKETLSYLGAILKTR